jgi:exopolysaccharide production protein ExoQ
MALLALLTCTGFVLFLLWIEWRASRDISRTVWIPTLWFMVMSSRPLGIWFQSGDIHLSGGNEAGSPMDRWTFTALAILAIIVFVSRRFDWRVSLRRHKWLVALLVYMFVSTLWSDFTSIALRRWVREAIVLVMAFCLMSERNPRQALAAVLRRTAYVLVPFSLMLIKYYPALGRAYGKFSGIEMWTGVTGQKNELGRMCMISVLFLLFALYVRWRERPRGRRLRDQAWADIGILFLAMFLLVASDSSTSKTSFILGAACFFGLQLFRRLKWTVPQTGLLVLCTVLIAFGVSTPFLGGTNLAGFTSKLGRDATLTGRTGVWADVIPAFEKHPVLGYGLGSFWTDERRKIYDIPTAHNGYLDILLELGEVGLAFYAVWLLSCTRYLHRALSHDYDWACLAICLLLVGLVYNVTESALDSFTEEMTTVVALAILVAPRKAVSLSERIKSRVASVGSATSLETEADWSEGNTWVKLQRKSTWT